jgi:uncharacterized membrane protein YkvA (DUF1232 family)
MAEADQQVTFLQQLIDELPTTARAIHDASAREELPTPARKVCVGALNYLLDLLDIFPDHYAGLGLADDASVLHLAAAQAIALGADDDGLRRAARHAEALLRLYGTLGPSFDKLVALLPTRDVRGRTADAVLGSKDVRAMFDGDVRRSIAALKPAPIDAKMGAEAAIRELVKMTRNSLAKAGVL